jgi:two-component sensor histidine kinase
MLSRKSALALLVGMALMRAAAARAVILWSDAGARVVHNTGEGEDNLGGKVKRDDKSNDELYFMFHVNPLSDVASEPYSAGFQLYEGDEGHLGVGNAEEAWGYSAFNTSEMGPSNKLADDGGEFNLKSSHPEPARLGMFWPYENVHQGVERTIVFKVQYVSGGDDLITVWLDPKLTHGSTAENQPPDLTTKFKANASFNQIRLRHNGGGNGWIFSKMAVATSFNDFVVVRFWQTWWFAAAAAVFVLGAVGAVVRIVEKRKYQVRLQVAERQNALEQERARIAQDLHDELGSLLTRISLLGGLLKADKDSPEQIETHAAKISQSANQTVRALEEIVWAVRPGSDSLQSLVDYIAHFASELFDGNNIHCRLDLPNNSPAWPLPPDMRHNIFLITKEALTNALKHSGAHEVQVQLKLSGRILEILVQDDGKGFDPETLADERRNGLRNMRRRAEAIGGKLELRCTPGTMVKLLVDLQNGIESVRV